MTIESEIAGLTQATTDLLDAVNVRKATLDQKVAEATTQASAATTKAGEASAAASSASTNATSAANSAGAAANSASQAAAITGAGSGAFGAQPISTDSTLTLGAGTANGVLYLNGSKVATSGSALTFDGTNFGIGVASPTYRIDIAGTNPRIRLNETTGYVLTSYVNNVGQFDVGRDSAAGAVSGASYAGFFDLTGNYPIVWRINAAEQMRLTSTGLGIGTSSPAYKFDVSGTDGVTARVKSTSGTTGNYAQLILDSFNSFSGTGQAYIRGVSLIPGNSNTALTFGVNSSGFGAPFEAMRIDSSGNLGLGVTPSAWESTYRMQQIGYGASVGGRTSAAQAYLSANWYQDGSGNKYIYNGYATQYQQDAGTHYWFTAPSGTAGEAISFTQAMDLADSAGASTLTVNSAINNASAIRLTTNGALSAGMFLANPTVDHSLGFQTAGSERARIDSSGNLLVGQTGTGYQNSNSCEVGATGRIVFNHASGTADGAFYAAFGYNTNGIGSITQNGTTAVSYNTSSDYRLKNITGPITTSGAYIDSLNPVEGTWKADGSTFVGLIAHEVQEVSRTQVATGEKDGEQMQAMDYSNSELIANLIAEVKSLRARVAALESN